MNILDTRDLIERRDELKETIFNSFIETFPQYKDQTDCFDDILFEEEEVQDWEEEFESEFEEINEIDQIENDLGSEFNYGVTLIDEGDFEEYCEELVSDIGDLPKELPSYISNNIDWSGVADDLKADYTDVTYRGINYLGR